jgi:hypothetical protein
MYKCTCTQMSLSEPLVVQRRTWVYQIDIRNYTIFIFPITFTRAVAIPECIFLIEKDSEKTHE